MCVPKCRKSKHFESIVCFNLISISGLPFASRFVMCLYWKLYTWCNYVSHIILIKRGFVQECCYVKIVMFICMYTEETQIKKKIYLRTPGSRKLLRWCWHDYLSYIFSQRWFCNRYVPVQFPWDDSQTLLLRSLCTPSVHLDEVRDTIPY